MGRGKDERGIKREEMDAREQERLGNQGEGKKVIEPSLS